MKDLHQIVIHGYCLLYIPHGSDERSHRTIQSFVSLTPLYPTWFRWKSSSSLISERWSLSLYPTWFRWKANSNLQAIAAATFISHMVQMKAFNDTISFSVSPFFISHMVQMKARVRNADSLFMILFISHMVQMKGLTTLSLRYILSLLYIPHGSDESCVYHRNSTADAFFISHMVQMKDTDRYDDSLYSTLYIPHGSDERTLTLKF